jgi:hypothetical protein
MHRPQNPSGVSSAVADQDKVPSQLPAEWMPEDVVVRLWARANAGHGWETLIPEYSIAGMGNTFDAAIKNAIELLDDYLSLCARDGLSFSEARRPLPRRDMGRLLAEYAVGRFVGKLSMGMGHSGRKRVDLPLRTLAAR